MNTAHHYPAIGVLRWTRRDIATITLISVVPPICYSQLGWHWVAIPWLPVALLGTAVAFMAGFKNNASYDRTWEARRVWGAIVNASRVWGAFSRDYLRAAPGEDRDVAAETHQLVLRHLGWLTALRFALREPRAWESMNNASNAEFRRAWFKVDEQDNPLEPALARYLSPEELPLVMGKANKAAQIIALQSAHLARLRERGLLDDFRHIELARVLTELLAQQGASERIKNFPYPRQYATMNLWFVRLFVALIPFGMIQEFSKLGPEMIWFSVPFSVLAGWVFNTMEKIGEGTENPFEGSANDVPITAMSRGIEIDLRQMIGDPDVPPPLTAVNQILT